jgi:hypothetical protein
MKSLAKSLVVGLIATGLFFFFLMMLVVPATALLARISHPDQAVFVNPTLFLRHFGLPLAAAVFVTTVVAALRRSPHPRGGAGHS